MHNPYLEYYRNDPCRSLHSPLTALQNTAERFAMDTCDDWRQTRVPVWLALTWLTTNPTRRDAVVRLLTQYVGRRAALRAPLLVEATIAVADEIREEARCYFDREHGVVCTLPFPLKPEPFETP
mgnify:CR=1 FL=1